MIDIIVVDIQEGYGVILREIGQVNRIYTLQPNGLTSGYHTKVSPTKSS